MATLKDVARVAGVSTATVARVLHDSAHVSDESRALVLAAINKTGYHLNEVAQGLRRQRSFALGHVILNVSPNQFFAGISLGVSMEAADRDCAVLMMNTMEDEQLERRAVTTLIRRRVDAILFTTLRDPNNLKLAQDAHIPAIQVERILDVSGHAVTVDNYRGSYDAVEHLIRLGHRRIAFIGETPELHSHMQRSREIERERLSGYRDAHLAAGLTIDDALVSTDGRYFDLGSIRAITRRVRSLATPPTAIFAACDSMAAAVLQELYQMGLRVPDDVSVIGYDDTLADSLTPPLTTIRQPMVDIGREAVRMAFDVIGDPSVRSPAPHGIGRRRRLETRLALRESTAPPPKQR